jgi:hypothetical protein
MSLFFLTLTHYYYYWCVHVITGIIPCVRVRLAPPCPTRKTTNLSQSGEVPKIGCLRFTFLRFLRFGFLSCTVRSTKKPTNLSQSGEVPKGGRRSNFWKNCSDGKVEGRDVKVSIGLHFWAFYVLVSFRVPSKGVILFLQNSKNTSSKRDLKNTLPVLVDHFDRCFSHNFCFWV